MILLLALFLPLYYWGAGRQALLVNTDMQSYDQSAYMNYAKKMHVTDYAHVGGRDRMPVYPFIMSLFYENGMSDKDFFELGKTINFLISLFVLAVCFFVFRLYSSGLDATVATGVIAFTVFVYKAPFFQVEILLYGVSFITFVLMLELLRRPKNSTAVVAGAAAGIVHLSKASVIPSILLSAACLLYDAVARLFSKETDRAAETAVSKSTRWRSNLRRFIYPVVFVAAFLTVIFPYIQTSKEVFGRYFYDVSSTFYMWYDSWEEATKGTKAHGDRAGWPTMLESEIPSMEKYFREHSVRQAVDRVTGGLASLWSGAAKSYGFMLFVFFYAIACTAIAWTNRRRFMHLLHDSRVRRLRLFFVTTYFCGYALLYAWYVPIGAGNRHLLTLMLPATFLFIRFLSYSQAQDLYFCLWGRRVHSSAVSPMAALLLLCYLVVLFPHQIQSLYGGS